MGRRKQSSESHSNDSEAEFLDYLDKEVPDSVSEGQEVSEEEESEEEEPDYEKQNRKNEKNTKKRGREDSSTKEPNSEKSEKTKKKGGDDNSPTKEPDAPPPKKRGRQSKPTTKKPAAPTLPIFKTTRIRKYMNRSSRKQLPNNKLTCIDCRAYELEECLLCGKEQHICDKGVVMKYQADYEWLWVCLECLVITADDSAMKNVRDS